MFLFLVFLAPRFYQYLPGRSWIYVDLCWCARHFCHEFLSLAIGQTGGCHTSSLPKSTTEPKPGRVELRKLECTLFFGGGPFWVSKKNSSSRSQQNVLHHIFWWLKSHFCLADSMPPPSQFVRIHQFQRGLLAKMKKHGGFSGYPMVDPYR